MKGLWVVNDRSTAARSLRAPLAVSKEQLLNRLPQHPFAPDPFLQPARNETQVPVRTHLPRKR